jgi:hypothetical protein
MNQIRLSRNPRDSLRSPLVSHFPTASQVAPSQKKAPVDRQRQQTALSEHQLAFVSSIERLAALTARSS